MNRDRIPKHQKHNRRWEAFIGILLGLGAPLGWLAWRTLYTHQTLLFPWFKDELALYWEIYMYLTLGSVIVFTLFGYLIGRKTDSVADETESVKKALNKFHVLAVTDALTGIYNARYLHEHLSIELESAQRYQTDLTCLMLDIDDFKSINDRFGHPSGDVVLATLAKILTQAVRRVDIVGRLGGEEFLIIMPHSSSQTAFAIAERIRQTVQQWPFMVQETIRPVTISVGVATYPAPGITDKGSILKAVDDALYEAKRSGKNKTVNFYDKHHVL